MKRSVKMTTVALRVPSVDKRSPRQSSAFVTAIAAGVASLFTPSAHAATKTWTAASGNEWNVTGNWSGGTPVGVDTALFNTALSSVTNAVADQSLTSISFDTAAGTASGTFTIGATGGNKLLLTSGGTVSLLSTLTGTAKTFTINSPIVIGSGAAAQSYTFANNNATATNILTFGGQISGGTTGTTTLTLGGSNAATAINVISGNIVNGSGIMAVTKTGATTWVLSGTNTYSGATTINAGALQFSASSNLGNASATNTISMAGGILELTSGSVDLGANRSITLTGSGQIVTDAAGTLTLSGNITSTAAVNFILSPSLATSNIVVSGNIGEGGGAAVTTLYLGKIGGSGLGSGNVEFTGTNSYSGVTTLNYASGGTLKTSGTNSSAGQTVVQRGTLILNNASNGGIASGTLTFGGNLQANTAAAGTLSNAISIGGFGPTVSGSQSITFNGDATVNAATQTLTNSLTAGTLTFAGSKLNLGLLTSSGFGLTLAGTGSTTINSVIQDYSGGVGTAAGSITFANSAGTTTLAGVNTYTGTTTISGTGTVLLSGSGTLGAVTNALTISAAGTLNLGGTTQTVGAVSMSAGGTISNGTLTGTSYSVSNASGTATVSAVLAGTGSTLNKTGAGTLVLNNTEIYTGATSLGTAGSATAGGTLTLSGANGSIATSTPTIVINGGGSSVTVNSQLNLDYAGVAVGSVNRVADTTGVTLNLGGELRMSGASTAATSATETIGTISLGSGTGIVSISNPAAATTGVTTLTAGFSRGSNLGTGLIRGTSLGNGSATTSRLILDAGGITALGQVGTNTSGAGVSTGTVKDLRIVPFLIGDTSATGTGSNFLTYDTTSGLRVLGSTEQTTLATTSTNANLNGGVPVNAAVNPSTTISSASGLTLNSLLLGPGPNVAFNGSGGSLTINSGAVASLVGSSVASIGSGFSSLILGNGEGVLHVTNSGTLTIATPISVTSSGGLTKSGSATAVLTAANLYTGVTTVNGGTLQIGNGTIGSIQSSSNITVNAGTTLALNQPNNTTFANNIVMNGTVTLVNTGTQTLSGTISGATTGSITQSTAGTVLIFSGTGNNYSGTTALTAGTLSTGVDNAFGTGTLSLTSGVVQATGGARTFSNSVTNFGTTPVITSTSNITFNGQLSSSTSNTILALNAPTTTLAGGIGIRGESTGNNRSMFLSGTGNIVVSGAITDGIAGTSANNLFYQGSGLMTLTGANTFTGSLGVAQGASAVVDYANAPSGTSTNFALAATMGLNLQGGTLEFKGKTGSNTTNQTIGNISTLINTGTNTITVNKNSGTATTITSGTLTRNAGTQLVIDQTSGGSLTTTSTVSNGILGGGIIVKNSAGRIDFAANSGAGTAITALTSLTDLPATASTATTNYRLNGTQTVTNSESINSVRIATNGLGNSLNVGTQNLIITSAGLLITGSDNYSINGSSGVIANGATNSSLLLQHMGTGALTITAKLGQGNGGLSIFGNGSNLVDLNTSTVLQGTLGGNQGALVVSNGTVRLSDSAAMNLGNSTATANGTGTIFIANGGILELTNTNLYRDSGSAGNAGVLAFTGSGGFSAFGADRTVSLSSINGANTGAALTWASTTGFLADGAKLILGSAFSTNTVDFTNPIALGASERIVEVRDGTSSSNIDGKLSGIISGTGSLTKTGAGTLSLTAVNTLSGATNVSAGKLLVNNSTGSGLGTSNVSLASGATLGGSGSFSGSVTAVANSTIAPGNSNGKLTIGNLTLGAGNLGMELGKTALTQPSQPVAGTDYDQLAVTGTTVNITGGVLVLSLGNFLENGDVYYIVDNQGANAITGVFASGSINGTAITGSFAEGGTLTADVYQFAISYLATAPSSTSGNDIALTAIAVPEPASLCLLGLGVGGLLARRRRAVGNN